MKMLVIILLMLHLARGASISSTCPDNCACQNFENDLELWCDSFNFIKTFNRKQMLSITALNINNASLTHISTKLKYLKNLQVLNLSTNNISYLPPQFPNLPKLQNLNLSKNHLKDVHLIGLPKNLQILDLSNNLIVYFSKEWTKFYQLKELRLHKNPISCDCNNLFIYEHLKTNKISTQGIICHTPKQFLEKPIDTVNCSMIKDDLLDTMLSDDSGSGEDRLGDSYFETSSPLITEQDEFLSIDPLSSSITNQEEFLSTDSITPSTHTLEEGSGDEQEEGSGLLIPIEEIPKACVFNCSTSKPLGLDDENDASPPPNLKDQIGIIISDIFGTEELTTTIKTTSTIHDLDEIVKEKEPVLMTVSDKEVEVFQKNYTDLGEMERASMIESTPQTVYIIVGLLVAFLAFAVIYYVNNKKKNVNNRKRNKPNENGFGEEMKPLEKPVLQKISTNKIEEAPLINGQKHPVDENVKPETEEQEKNYESDVEMRKPNKQELLTPQLERVTIKSGEIPDSVPKTPMLVHRQLNNDGEIVTTVISK